jgi:hypothetical protein
MQHTNTQRCNLIEIPTNVHIEDSRTGLVCIGISDPSPLFPSVLVEGLSITFEIGPSLCRALPG